MATVTIPEPNLVVLEGEIDMKEAPRVRDRLAPVLAGQPDRLVIDMTGVGYMDSSGLAVLIEAFQRLGSRGDKIALFGLQPAVQNVFRLARLDLVFAIYADKAAALAG